MTSHLRLLHRLKRGLRVVHFNWPYYLLSGFITFVILAVSPLLPRFLEPAVCAAVFCMIFWSLGSIIASCWIYGFSGLYGYRALQSILPDKSLRWANLHAGLNEAGCDLRRMFGDGINLDVFDPILMTAGSLRRARKKAILNHSCDPRSLPIASRSLDAVFVIFTAHEIRDKDACDAFFSEVRRVLCAGGLLVLIEHVRDLPNFLAFGPGFLHFQPDRRWIHPRPGFEMSRRFRITPFVQIYVFREVSHDIADGDSSLGSFPARSGGSARRFSAAVSVEG